MRNFNKKGFTLIELLAVIIILGVLMLIAIPSVTEYINNSRKNAYKQSVSLILSQAKTDYINSYNNGESTSGVTYSYNNSVESSNIEGKTLNYKGKKPKEGIIEVTDKGDVAAYLYDGTYCAYKSVIDKEVNVEKMELDECNLDYSVLKKINVPKLADGMIPIKWNGTSWVETVESDDDWYEYDTINKKWANAKTADGSMWVWIPRYIYRITSNWHSNTAGTIEVQFSKGINDDWNQESVAMDNGATSNASNNKWTNHPTFKFGGTDITGIWVAKFEASSAEGNSNVYTSDSSCPNVGDNNPLKTVKIIPNTASWGCLSVDNTFIASRSMETNSIYGWSGDGTGLDTHLMKNTEWGAVAYLSKSQYGINNVRIYKNNSQEYITGCAGNTETETIINACQNTYETALGVMSSTTGTVYGVYDMRGGRNEYTAAYLNNGHANLQNGATLVAADSKYKDIYQVGTTDSQIDNYALTINKKGDAIYEISNNAGGSYSWNSELSYVTSTSATWQIRGGANVAAAGAGTFFFSRAIGSAGPVGFRPVLIVGNNL